MEDSEKLKELLDLKCDVKKTIMFTESALEMLKDLLMRIRAEIVEIKREDNEGIND